MQRASRTPCERRVRYRGEGGAGVALISLKSPARWHVPGPALPAGLELLQCFSRKRLGVIVLRLIGLNVSD